MTNLRIYGRTPYDAAVIHGGPGAGGEMAPVARRLAVRCGILEPIQTAESLYGQVTELQGILEVHGSIPVVLIGFSWGAWLAYIVSAYFPNLVRKLILVSSGPFEDQYVDHLKKMRQSRLDDKERKELESILYKLGDPLIDKKDTLLSRLAAITRKTDAFDSIPDEMSEMVHVTNNDKIYDYVWKEAAELRRTGRLLEIGKTIRCPVVAIHGKYDPHPAEGVREPLSRILRDFKFLALENCGHTPWLERQAREAFFEVLRNELTNS